MYIHMSHSSPKPTPNAKPTPKSAHGIPAPWPAKTRPKARYKSRNRPPPAAGGCRPGVAVFACIPLTTTLALYFSSVPSFLVFLLKTHLRGNNFLPGGTSLNGISFEVWFAIIDMTSLLIASCQKTLIFHFKCTLVPPQGPCKVQLPP